MSEQKNFPEGMKPLGNECFNFACHSEVSCFTVCCQKVDLILYPFDIIQLKNRLEIDSEDFIRKYGSVVKGDNPYFPTVMLALTDQGKGDCPFLLKDGCAVYEDRPTACRTYPLERALDRNPDKRGRGEFYFLTDHDYCKGHLESAQVTAKEYVRSQKLARYNTFNDMWAEVDTLFRSNPWKGEGAGGPAQQLAFMVLYNVDGFRRFAQEKSLFDHFKITRKQREQIATRDEELLKFGFEWLKHIFGGRSSLIRK